MIKWMLTIALTLSTAMALAQSRPGHGGRGPAKPKPGPQRPAPAPAPAPRIELREAIRAVGYDYRDCDYRMQSQAYSVERRLIQSCQNQSRMQCFVSSRRHMGGGYIHPITGSYRVDDYKIDARTCRDRAAQRAEQDAMSRCQQEYGVRCYVTRRGVADHRVERKRRYGIMGPKENFQVCRGDAQAAPDSRYREQCSMQITVSNY